MTWLLNLPWWIFALGLALACMSSHPVLRASYGSSPVLPSIMKETWPHRAPLLLMYGTGFVLLLPLYAWRYFRWHEEAQQMNDLAGRVANHLRYLPEENRYPRFWHDFVDGALRAQIHDERKTQAYTADAEAQRLAGPISYLKRMVGEDEAGGLGAIYLDAFNRLAKQLPRYVGAADLFRTPLFSVLHTGMIDDFFHAFEREDRMLWSIFSRYTQNWYAARAAIEERVYPKDGPRHIAQLVEGTGFEIMFSPQTTLPIAIPEKLRFEGVWVIAPPGRGKTTLLSRLLVQDFGLVAANRASIILMDSKGDLIDHARRLKQFGKGERLEDRLVLIEPRADLSINPLDLGANTGQTLSLCEYIFDALLETETTPKQGSVFRRVLIAMQAIPGANFQTFLSFLRDWRPYERHLQTLEPEDRDFFLNGSYDGKDYRGTRDELHWRIDALMTKVPLLRQMFKATETRIDIAKEMDAGKVIIIDNSAATLGAGSEFFARFFVALVLAAGQQRAGRKQEDKLPCYFYIDECHTVIARDPSTASILQQCRSQKIGLVLAHQQISQIKLDDVKGALADCAVRFANSDEDAPQLASRFRITTDALRSLKRGQFALFMRDATPGAITIDVPNYPLSDWPKMSEQEFVEIQKDMAARFCHDAQAHTPKAKQEQQNETISTHKADDLFAQTSRTMQRQQEPDIPVRPFPAPSPSEASDTAPSAWE